jgi:hypothetical protein
LKRSEHLKKKSPIQRVASDSGVVQIEVRSGPIWSGESFVKFADSIHRNNWLCEVHWAKRKNLLPALSTASVTTLYPFTAALGVVLETQTPEARFVVYSR